MYCYSMTYAKNSEQVYSSVEGNKPASVGLMVVERFEDGSESFSIVGHYKDHRDTALDSAIELTVYAKNRWRGLEE